MESQSALEQSSPYVPGQDRILKCVFYYQEPTCICYKKAESICGKYLFFLQKLIEKKIKSRF